MLYCKSLNVNFQYFILSTLVNYLCLLFSAKLQVIEYSATIPKFPELLLEISVKVDDGLEWKDEYAMGWRVLLAKGCTVCTPDGARHGRARIGAFRSKPLANYKNQTHQIFNWWVHIKQAINKNR